VDPDELWALAAWVRARAGIVDGKARSLAPDADEQLGWRIDVERE
jgi:hypothetical protein